MANCKVIAVTNQKGGVGKTTTTANLGIGLAQENKRVLLIDADAQASLTLSLGYPKPDELPVTLADIMQNVIDDTPIPDGHGILHHGEGVDLLPANIELSGMEIRLINATSRENVLRTYINEVKPHYDYILIDCMPSLGIMPINSWAAADSIIIPSQPSFLSAKGLDLLMHSMSQIKRKINPKLKIDGILFTMVDSRTNEAKEIIASLRSHYGDKIRVFGTEIPFSVRAAETSGRGKSIYAHTVPSFASNQKNSAQTYTLKYDQANGNYSLTLTDTNNVLKDIRFSSSSGITVTRNGNKYTFTSKKMIENAVGITAQKVIPNSLDNMLIWGCPGKQTMTSGAEDPVFFYLNIKTETTGVGHIVKHSEDGKVGGIRFTITGNGVNKTVTTKADGTVDIELMPGVYTVTEEIIDKYEPQNTQRVTIVSDGTSTVTFSNVLKRGNLTVTKTSEDGLNEGVKFHLFGTSLSGLAVDEYAVTDSSGKAYFRNVLIGTGYTLEEVDTAIRYVVPENQTAAVEWNKVTNKSFINILKKWNVTVTKSDSETGTPQGDASLAGAVYGIYKGEQLIDTYTTDANGQFTTKFYVCGDDWSVREITPSEGYLLDESAHHIGAEAKNYTVEYNSTANDVTETIIKGNIALIKHTDDGSTQLETPEVGAEFEVFLKTAGSYAAAKNTERDYLVCDENGFTETKMLPYGIYTVHQVKGWDGRELLPDFDVYIAKDGQTYRYLANNANFESYIKIVKVDAETGKVIPYAGAGFQLYRPDGSLITQTFTYPSPTTIDTFYTNDEGTLITPEKLEYGTGYSLIEVFAPYGYTLNSDPVYFDVVQEDSTDEGGVTVIEVVKENTAQKGVLKISKSGEGSPDEYAADRISGGTETAARETAHQLDKFGRKGVKDTKENISKVKDHFQQKKADFPKKQAQKSILKNYPLYCPKCKWY